MRKKTGIQDNWLLYLGRALFLSSNLVLFPLPLFLLLFCHLCFESLGNVIIEQVG